MSGGSGESKPEEQKKPSVLPVPPRPGSTPAAGSPVAPSTGPAGGASTPTPAPRTGAPMPPRPATPVAPAQAAPSKPSRRRFLTLFAVVGGLLTLVPWIPNMGSFLSSSAAGATTAAGEQTIVLDDNPLENGNASGKTVNVKDLTTFPPNSTWVMTYPSSGNPTTDGQNSNTFVKFALIRLPKELGGANPNASAFVAFSKVCVHLWCSPNYIPEQCSDPSENGYLSGSACATHEQYECPCHGSTYTVGLDGKPVGLSTSGPASVQPSPTNAIPLLTLTTDASGNLQVVPPIWDIDHNGVIGYGRTVGNGAFTGGYNPQ
jgi:rieske iron-sulfur protein